MSRLTNYNKKDWCVLYMLNHWWAFIIYTRVPADRKTGSPQNNNFYKTLLFNFIVFLSFSSKLIIQKCSHALKRYQIFWRRCEKYSVTLCIKKETIRESTGYFHKYHIHFSQEWTPISLIIETTVETHIKSVFSKIKLSTGKKGLRLILRNLKETKNRHYLSFLSRCH